MTVNPQSDGSPIPATLLNAHANAVDGFGVYDGLDLSVGSGSWDVDFAAGTALVGGHAVGVSSGTETVTAPGSDADLDSGEFRVDLLSVDASGTVNRAEGTAGSTPVAEDIPAGETAFGLVLVSGDASSLGSSDLYEIGVPVASPPPLNVRDIYAWTLSEMVNGNYVGDPYPGAGMVADQRTGTTVTTAGTVIEQITHPMTNPLGVAVDPTDGTIWSTHASIIDGVQHHDRLGNVFSTFDYNEGTPSDIAVDPVDGTLWFADTPDDRIYHKERDGTGIGSFASPAIQPTGMGLDPATGNLWFGASADIYEFDQAGVQQSTFSYATTGGLGVDPGDGTLWVNDFDADDVIENLQQNGTSITSFSKPGGDSGGVSVDPVDGTLLHYDNNDGVLYHISPYASIDIAAVGSYTFGIQPR